MLGKNAMTHARMTTARRQIASKASHRGAKNVRPATRSVAVRRLKSSSNSPWKVDFGTFRLVSARTQAEFGLTRSVHPARRLPEQTARSSSGEATGQTGKGWSCMGQA